MYTRHESLNIHSTNITIRTIDNNYCSLQLNSSIFCINRCFFLWWHADTSSFLELSELSSGWQIRNWYQHAATEKTSIMQKIELLSCSKQLSIVFTVIFAL